MPDIDRSAEMLRLIVDAAYDYYGKHGHYPARVRVGATVGRYLLKPGEREGRIPLRPGGTSLWIAVVVGDGLGPLAVIAES